jgi:hypothetical protein
MKTRSGCLFFLMMVSGSTFACSIPPEDSKSFPVEAVMEARSAGVVVFRKFSSSAEGVEFHADLSELFWGSKSDLKSVLYKTSRGAKYLGPAGGGGRHDSADFWVGDAANSAYGRDCLLVPNIRLGVPYVFLSTPKLGRYSIEPIQGKDDPWYRLIRKVSSKRRIGK